MKSLTVFTPTWNRAHTLPRLYQSLCCQTLQDFEWLVIDDGSTDGTRALVRGWIEENRIPVRYVWKENGGLYTGYNEAYSLIETELNVCVDSDDAMPPRAVEEIVRAWGERGSDRYAGLIGIDCVMENGTFIGGAFPSGMTECWLMDLYARRIHHGDAKQVMRTDLMKQVAPQEGFPGEGGRGDHDRSESRHAWAQGRCDSGKAPGVQIYGLQQAVYGRAGDGQ